MISQVIVQFVISQQCIRVPVALHTQAHSLINPLKFSHFCGWKGVSRCGFNLYFSND